MFRAVDENRRNKDCIFLLEKARHRISAVSGVRFLSGRCVGLGVFKAAVL
jgi:hypothetical protein